MTGNDWEARQQDDERMRPRDCETARRRDDETARLRDCETAEKHRRSQAFSVVLSRSQLCVAVRGSLASEGCRVLHSAKMPSMGSTKAYVPLTAFFVRGRNRPLITTRAWWEKGCRCVLSQKRVPWDSTKTYSPRYSTFWDRTQMRPYHAKLSRQANNT